MNKVTLLLNDKRASTAQAREEAVAMEYVQMKINQALEQGIEFTESMLDPVEFAQFALDKSNESMFTLDHGAQN
jgi:hypothetical protein